MKQLNPYRQLIQKVLAEHSRYKLSYGDLEQFTIYDTENDPDQLTTVA
ncbi:element excision factor XisI family protein [Lyngbya sp. CCY1209]|nr:element excision factor XisI family protein [Lyngbya sp. CCY1209]MEB3882768.1 XisI protein [Lyngbya sp. CCY1209]